MTDALGVPVALAAGASFAAAGVLQQRAAAQMPANRSLSARLIIDLARHPSWLAGMGLAGVSYGLQALALSASPLAVVQPLLVSELVFAIPVSARLQGRRLGIQAWLGLVAVAAGIGAAVWGVAPSGGNDGTAGRWVVVAGTMAVAAVILAAIGRRRRPLVKASLYAAAAALAFALSSAFLASVVDGFKTIGFSEVLKPEPYALTAVSLAGLVLIQSAYQAGPLAVTMPMLDWVEPLAAVVLGVFVLGESVDTSAPHLSALALGAVAALGGIAALDSVVRQRLDTARPALLGEPSVDTGAAVDAGTAAAHAGAAVDDTRGGSVTAWAGYGAETADTTREASRRHDERHRETLVSPRR
ncbi:MAG: DMT family transporter [Acidimicrobiales bacterium]